MSDYNHQMKEAIDRLTRRSILASLRTVGHFNTLVRNLAQKHLGRSGKDWAEHSRGDTFGIVVPNDQGQWPGRGMGRFSTIPVLLRQFKAGMPQGLPEFLMDMHHVLKGGREPLLISGVNKFSVRWLCKGCDAEDSEEWSIQLEDEYPKLGRTASTRQMKTAGEVRFIKDRGGDHNEWGWNPPGASERAIDPDYEFDPINLKPLAKTLRSALMALGHIQTARTTFTKIRSQRISPDGNLGGKGYVMPIKDIRKQLANCDEALSSLTDCIYDEMQAVHWHPDVTDSGGNPRERGEVRQIMDDVEEIREDPEEWADDAESDMDGGDP